MPKLLVRITLLIVFFAGTAPLVRAEWETDLPKAQERAKRENKPIFLLFTGSSWCTYCQLLEQKILSRERFRQFANQRFIAVKINFSEPPYYSNTPPSSAKERAKFEWAKSFDMNVGQPNTPQGLNGYPSVFILAADGTRLGEIPSGGGASEAGVEAYIKAITLKITPPATP